MQMTHKGWCVIKPQLIQSVVMIDHEIIFTHSPFSDSRKTELSVTGESMSTSTD